MADVWINENDEGVQFTFTVKDEDGTVVDLTDFFEGGSDVAEVRFLKPDGSTTADKDLTVITAASGTCQYTSEASFLTPAGAWKCQLHFYGATENKRYRTSIARFIVHENL
jgi:hypothetical protein